MLAPRLKLRTQGRGFRGPCQMDPDDNQGHDPDPSETRGWL